MLAKLPRILDKNNPSFLTWVLSRILSVSCLRNFTHDSDKILVKILSRILSCELVSIFLARITQDSDMILLNDLVKSLVIILVARINQDSDMILDKNPVRILSRFLSLSCSQNYPRFWQDIWRESCQNLEYFLQTRYQQDSWQELPKFLTWFLSRILWRYLFSIILARIVEDSDLILVKNVVKNLVII